MNKLLPFLLLLILNQAQAISLKDYLALPANPVNIGVVLGTEKVTQKLSAKDGGALTLTTSQGDRFELTIPPHSLLQDTEITIRQVTSVQHSEFSASAVTSSVELLPDGIQLAVPATLVFKPKSAFALQSLTAFSAEAGGQDAHIAMLLDWKNQNEVKLGLLHFSNYTISNDPNAEEIIANGLSQMEITRIASWMNRQILKAKKSGANIKEELDKAFQESFDTVVGPSLHSVNSCASGLSAFEFYTNWSRQIQLMGAEEENYTPPDFNSGLLPILAKVGDQCFELAKTGCYSDHQPIAVLNYALRFSRIGQLIASPQLVDKFMGLAGKCSKFKFFMDSEIWVGEDRKDSSGVTAKAEFDFSFDPLTRDMIEGSIDVENTYLNISGFNCEKVSSENRPSHLLINNFLLQETSDTKDFTILIGGITPYSYANFRCVDLQDPEIVFQMGIPQVPMGSYYGGLFIGTHGPTGLNEMIMDTAFFAIKGWEVRHDTRYACKQYTHVIEALNEATTIIIYHTPEPL